MKKLIVSTFISLLLICTAFGDITGSYMDRQDDFIVYVQLTQMKDKLSGFMQVVQADPEMTWQPKATVYRLSGTIYNKALSLRREGSDGQYRGFEGKVVATGIELNSPSESGYITRLMLRSCTASSWNKQVSRFEEELVAEYYRKQWIETFQTLTDDLSNRISNAESMIVNSEARIPGIRSSIDSAKTVLTKFRDELPDLERQLVAPKIKLAAATDSRIEAEKRLTEDQSDKTQAEYTQALNVERSAKETVLNIESAIVSHKQTMANYESNLKSLEKQLVEIDKSIADANKMITETHQILEVLKKGNFESRLRNLKPNRFPRALAIRPVNVYLTPDAKSQVVDKHPASEPFKLFPLDGPWHLVELGPKMIGWIEAKDVKLL